MCIWNNRTMTTRYHPANAQHDRQCVVKIDGNKFLVEYQ